MAETSLNVSFDPLDISSLETDLQDLDVLLNSPQLRPKRQIVSDNDASFFHIDSAISPSSSTDSNGNNNDDHDNSGNSTQRISPRSQFLNNNANISNAVHMEVQENAKVPNLYHVPIRRSGGYGHHVQQQSQIQQHQQVSNNNTGENSELVDEILRLTEEDLTLTEKFLGNGHRYVYAIFYSFKIDQLMRKI